MILSGPPGPLEGCLYVVQVISIKKKHFLRNQYLRARLSANCVPSCVTSVILGELVFPTSYSRSYKLAIAERNIAVATN